MGSGKPTATPWWLVLVLLLAAILRIVGTTSDLWLDEIWSINVATAPGFIDSLVSGEILDGHLSLYSLYLNLVGPGADAWIYRLPALLLGIGSLYLLALIARPSGALVTNLTLLLASFSFFHVIYSTEARGYAPMLFFALFSVLVIDQASQKFHPRHTIALAAAATLALSFHPSFLPFYLALIFWSFDALRGQALAVLKLHWLTAALLGVLYLCLLANLPPGSGPYGSYLAPLIDYLTTPLVPVELTYVGDSEFAIVPAITIVVVLSFSLAILVHLFKNDRSQAWLHLSALIVPPLLVVALVGPKVLLPRYFLPSIALNYLLAARVLARLWNRSRDDRMLVAILLSLFFLFNLFSAMKLWYYGKGEYRALMRYLSENSGAEIAVAGDQDFRISTVLNYYAPMTLKSDQQLRYISAAERSSIQPTWYLEHLLGYPGTSSPHDFNYVLGRGKPVVVSIEEHSYQLVNQFHNSGFVGWRTLVFRLQE